MMKSIYKYLSAAAMSSLFLVNAISAAESDFEIKNGRIAVSFDAKGNLTSLKNLENGYDYAGGEGLWRVIYQQNELLEEPVESDAVPVSVKKVSGSEIKLDYGGEFPVSVSCKIEGNDVKFTAEISNKSKDKILREFQFPLIKNANISPNAGLVNSVGGGQFIPNFYGYVKGAKTYYKSQDNVAVERYAAYPVSRTMNMFVIRNGDAGSLYFASMDPEFELTLHLARYRKVNDEFKYLDIGMVKYPFLKSGETYATGSFCRFAAVGRLARRREEIRRRRQIVVQKSFRSRAREKYERLAAYDFAPPIWPNTFFVSRTRLENKQSRNGMRNRHNSSFRLVEGGHGRRISRLFG